MNQAQGVRADVVARMRGNEHPSIAPFETFATGDRQIMICAGNDRQFTALCRVLGDRHWSRTIGSGPTPIGSPTDRRWSPL